MKKKPVKPPMTGKKAARGAPETERRRTGRDGRKPSDRFLRTLLAKRQELEEALNGLMARQKEYEDQQSADDFIEKGDHAEREISAQTHYSLLERKNRELKKIDMLIRRTEQDNEFGICEDCGRRIPPRRLLIVPDATRCVPCQQEMERMDSRGAPGDKYGPQPRPGRDTAWEEGGGLSDEDSPVYKPDMELDSFLDLDETDLMESDGDKN